MADSKTADQRVQQRREDAAEKTAANKRQEQSVKDQQEQAEKQAVPARSKDDTLTVMLRDSADSTVDSVSRLLAQQGAFLKSAKGNKITFGLPPESERNPDSQRQRIAASLLKSPHVEGLE